MELVRKALFEMTVRSASKAIKDNDHLKNNDDCLELLKPYHEKVKNECPDFDMFCNIVLLNIQYGFIGMAML